MELLSSCFSLAFFLILMLDLVMGDVFRAVHIRQLVDEDFAFIAEENCGIRLLSLPP